MNVMLKKTIITGLQIMFFLEIESKPNQPSSNNAKGMHMCGKPWLLDVLLIFFFFKFSFVYLDALWLWRLHPRISKTDPNLDIYHVGKCVTGVSRFLHSRRSSTGKPCGCHVGYLHSRKNLRTGFMCVAKVLRVSARQSRWREKIANNSMRLFILGPLPIPTPCTLLP
jgi:hypothetical protein